MRLHSIWPRSLGLMLWTVMLGLGTACGPAVLDYSLVESPSGDEFKLEELVETVRPDGQQALLLRYRTDLALSDTSALELEVATAWEYLRPRVEALSLRVAVIQAAHWELPSWERRGAAAQYVVELSPDGRWALHVDSSLVGPPS